MANKHFTTSDVRRIRDAEERAKRIARQQREQERRDLLALQHKFNMRGGRVVS
jgi:hypothetical protein